MLSNGTAIKATETYQHVRPGQPSQSMGPSPQQLQQNSAGAIRGRIASRAPTASRVPPMGAPFTVGRTPPSSRAIDPPLNAGRGIPIGRGRGYPGGSTGTGGRSARPTPTNAQEPSPGRRPPTGTGRGPPMGIARGPLIGAGRGPPMRTGRGPPGSPARAAAPGLDQTITSRGAPPKRGVRDPRVNPIMSNSGRGQDTPPPSNRNNPESENGRGSATGGRLLGNGMRPPVDVGDSSLPHSPKAADANKPVIRAPMSPPSLVKNSEMANPAQAASRPMRRFSSIN